MLVVVMVVMVMVRLLMEMTKLVMVFQLRYCTLAVCGCSVEGPMANQEGPVVDIEKEQFYSMNVAGQDLCKHP